MPLPGLLECFQGRSRAEIEAALRADPEAALALLHHWPLHARPEQLPPPGDWAKWFVCGGRGMGKTRCGAEWVRAEVESGGARRIALVAPTAGDARDVMVEGESGILAISPPWNRPKYEPSKRRLTWSNGALATTYSADEPERLRGPQHDRAWCDEPASWRYPEAWDNLMLGLRLGIKPRVLVTGTPKPVRLVRELLDQRARGVVVTRGSTYANRENLAASFFEDIVAKYEGTRLGRQELNAELLDDTPGALWVRTMIDRDRRKAGEVPELVRVVVGVDPAVTSGDDADETGIVVAGKGVDGHAYVLHDRSCRLSPDGWAKRAVAAYEETKAARIIAEVNNGGDLVEAVIRTVRTSDGLPVSYRAVRASRGKRVRAEPIAALYEQGKVHHIGCFAELEDQMCNFTPETAESPDRLDALVWALTDLMGTRGELRVY